MRLPQAPARLPLALALGLSLVAVSRAEANTEPPRLDAMIRESGRIVVAQVDTEGIREARGERWATAKVSETWKGEAAKTVEFRASPTFAGDITQALPGEDVLLFLRPIEGGGWEVVASGRGRMPLQTMDGRTYASLYLDVVLPADSQASRHCSDQPGYDRTIELGTLRESVTRAIASGK